jgi:hypothetical protein
MSFFSIPPIGASPYTSAPSAATGAKPAAAPAKSYAAAASQAAVDVDVDTSIPGSPPAEVLDQMQTAAGAQDRLAATGKALHFDLDESGKLTVQVTDLSGSVLGTASPSSVLDVASGKTL